MADVQDDEFADIRLDEGQRISDSRNFEHVNSVRGAGAIKGIFNKQNKWRVGFALLAGGVLFGSIIYFSFFAGPPELKGQAGETKAGVRVAGSTTSDQKTSKFVKDAAEQYNQTELEERHNNGDEQAHPIIVTDPSGETQKEENPFKPAVTAAKPGKVTEIGRTETVAPSQNPNQVQQNQQQQDTVLQQLVTAEAEVPKVKTVSWSYSSPAKSSPKSDGLASLPTEGTGAGTASKVSKCDRIEKGGAMAVATADFAVNSDIGGPISLTVRSGRARGRQLTGQFERKDKWLRIELNKMLSEDMDPVTVKAIALDMDTTMSGVEGDLDSHLLYRYGWWGFGAILSAVGKAAENNANEQVVVADGAVVTSATQDSSRELKMALGSLGQDLGDAFKDRINRPITVTLKVGEEVGVYFLDDVCAAN